MALMSGKVYSNTGAPNNADGVDGDIYMQLDGFKTTYRKESGAWVAVGSTLGAIPEIISGVGAPSNLLGADEQYYRNTENQDIYYKQGSTWNLVGNLQGVAFVPVLNQAGIGKDLATSPNLLNSGSLNDVITPGEYFYTTGVTDTPSTYGLMKVWRENSTYIYQLVQTSDNRLFHRYTGTGGTTWTTWKTYANVSGAADQRFKVATAVDADDAIRLEQVSKITGLFHTQREIYDTPGTHDFLLEPNKTIRVLLVGGGAGGGGIRDVSYAAPNGPLATDGGDSSIYPQGAPSGFFLKCKGGIAGESPTTSNGSNAVFGSHGTPVEVETNNTYSAVVLNYQDGKVMPNHSAGSTPVINHPTLKALSLTNKGQGGLGGGTSYGLAGSGSGGAFAEAIIKNEGNTNLNLKIEIGAGGVGNTANEGVGADGNDGVCILFY